MMDKLDNRTKQILAERGFETDEKGIMCKSMPMKWAVVADKEDDNKCSVMIFANYDGADFRVTVPLTADALKMMLEEKPKEFDKILLKCFMKLLSKVIE